MTGGTQQVAARRRQRAVEKLAAANVDVLVVGWPSNLDYLTGMERALVRGSRPFSPLAVLTVPDGDTHVQTFTRAGVPDELVEGLFPMSWSPQGLEASLAAIPALKVAKRVGVDAMSPEWYRRLRALAPQAEMVDTEPLLSRLRMVKTDDELVLISEAIDVLRNGVKRVVEAIQPGRRESELRALFSAQVAAAGMSVPHEGLCCVVDEDRPLRRLPANEEVTEGSHVVTDFSLIHHGYEVGMGRTVARRAGAAYQSAQAGWLALRAAVLETCRPGATGAALLSAAETGAGDGLVLDRALPVAYGYGFGPESPLQPTDTVEESQVLALQAYLHEAGSDLGYLGRDMVLVRPDGGHLLSDQER